MLSETQRREIDRALSHAESNLSKAGMNIEEVSTYLRYIRAQVDNIDSGLEEPERGISPVGQMDGNYGVQTGVAYLNGEQLRIENIHRLVGGGWHGSLIHADGRRERVGPFCLIDGPPINKTGLYVRV